MEQGHSVKTPQAKMSILIPTGKVTEGDIIIHDGETAVTKRWTADQGYILEDGTSFRFKNEITFYLLGVSGSLIGKDVAEDVSGSQARADGS